MKQEEIKMYYVVRSTLPIIYHCKGVTVLGIPTEIDGWRLNKIYKNKSLSDMTGEKWAEIEGYEGFYMVSNYGRVKSLRRNKIIAQGKNNCDYMMVNLRKNGEQETCTVQRLVATNFVENPYNKPQVNHILEGKRNKRINCWFNLSWMTAGENCRYGTRDRRRADKMSIPVICVDTGVRYKSATEACRQTGICQSSIRLCCLGKIRHAGRFHWKFA